MSLPKVSQEYFPLGGGLDLVTPQIALKPGMLFDCMNYEPEISGGYSRIDGFERFDGRTSPTSAAYWILMATITGTLAVGNTITGLTSGATAKILLISGSTLIIGRLTGTFVVSEALQVAAVTQATTTSYASKYGEQSASNDADYCLLAADDRRADILVVPGSGQIRGVAVYRDVVYAFRDNAAGTAGDMYKSTSSGWVKINFGVEVQFTAATGQINVGDTVTQGAVSGVVMASLLRTGSWTSGVGTLVFASLTGGSFTAGALSVSGVSKATSSGASTAITRLPGGRVEYVNANFTGSTDTVKMYGCDGVNSAFEFDGTTYIPIHTGMATDTPSHIMFHRSYLFLSFWGSVQYSSVNNPYGWSVVTGAGEIAVGDKVTGILPQGASNSGSSLAIFTSGKTHILYGSSSIDFQLTTSKFEIGYLAYTMQSVSNNTYGLTGRGIQSLLTTLTYGDFDYASISHLIQPLMTRMRGLESASVTLRTKDQYRLFFTDGTGVVMGITGDKPSGLLTIDYKRPVRCITSTTNASGQEVTYFGSDDGYIYQDNIGTSFDGAVIESWIRPAFNHSKSPRQRKRYRRAVFEVKPYGYSQINIGYDLGYANPDVIAPTGISNTQILGGGFWGQFTWDQFTWDAKIFSDVSMSLTGTEKNISFFFYSSRAQDRKHTVQGITLAYSLQRSER